MTAFNPVDNFLTTWKTKIFTFIAWSHEKGENKK